MPLEDHAGDIVRKARMMARLPAAEAAALAGLTREAYEAFEADGRPPAAAAWPALGARLGLATDRLPAIAAGWEPAAVDPARWGGLRVLTTEQEGLAVHSYLFWDPATREAALVDTGWDIAAAEAVLREHGLKLAWLLVTHGHRDHVAALADVRARHPAAQIRSEVAGTPAAGRNRPGEALAVGALRVGARATPGHAADGMTYVVTGWPGGAPPVAFVGDAIFAGSMGGAPEHGELARGRVRGEILTLPPATLLCPGHGPLTTVAEERAHNPFFP
jgi:glyoxylase-like metal-dependent hydrolase (beta-lactamase superfamily II)